MWPSPSACIDLQKPKHTPGTHCSGNLILGSQNMSRGTKLFRVGAETGKIYSIDNPATWDDAFWHMLTHGGEKNCEELVYESSALLLDTVCSCSMIRPDNEQIYRFFFNAVSFLSILVVLHGFKVTFRLEYGWRPSYRLAVLRSLHIQCHLSLQFLHLTISFFQTTIPYMNNFPKRSNASVWKSNVWVFFPPQEAGFSNFSSIKEHTEPIREQAVEASSC